MCFILYSDIKLTIDIKLTTATYCFVDSITENEIMDSAVTYAINQIRIQLT